MLLKPFVLTLMILVSNPVWADREQSAKNYLPIFSTNQSIQKRYSFAIHPLHNPQRLFDNFNPLVQYLNGRIRNAELYLEASKDYPSFDDKLAREAVDFALPNPYQTITSLNYNYRVIAKMGDDFNFRGIILLRKESKINDVTELKGKTISYPAPSALAATMMPQFYLYENGLDVMNDTTSLYVGSQESSIMNVFQGDVDAAATWPTPWELLIKELPEISEKIKVMWQTETLPNNGVVAHKRVPQQLSQEIQRLLANMHHNKEGQRILKKIYLSKFEHANNETFAPVSNFIKTFTQKIRHPEAAN
jgi:phosphonate transport system substrate-binding protein